MANPQDELSALREQLATLTSRVYKLEQALSARQPEPQALATPRVPPASVVQPATPPAARNALLPKIPPPPPPMPPAPKIAPLHHAGDNELEGKIGRVWLNRIGIAAVLIGVSYGLKYAFDVGLVGPAGRIIIGLAAGIAVVVWSELFRSRGYLPFSWSLKAVGIGTIYLSLWAAFQVYHLVPIELAFGAMLLVTAFTIILALTQDAEILAAYALVGGFSTPLLLSTGKNAEIFLFSYTALLDIAMLVMVFFKPWRRLLTGSFIGTVLLYVGWYSEFYTDPQRQVTVFFTLLLGAIFAAVPLVTPLTPSRWHSGAPITLTILPLVNAAAVFLALFAMYERERVTLTWYALGLAAGYLILSSQFKRRLGSDAATVKLVNMLHLAIAIAFITIAIPLKLDEHWITIGWLIESAALLYISVKTKTDFLRFFAGATLALGIVRLLMIDNFSVQTLVFNARFATYLVAIAILAGIVAAGDHYASEAERPLVRVAAVILNLLALRALTLEAGGYFDRQIAHTYPRNTAQYQMNQQLAFARDLSYSVIWLVYGAGLMLFGFWKQSSFVRWQALVLMAVTIGKVFIYDTWNLEQGYRVLSFIALGVVLMGLSYIYHRDWLRLSRRSRPETA
ncbi:MAG TPA: DUF2339 domain-containing protein [Candidatus Angelobacter sp.]|jgi:uncharacterized membrane protein|nr:DUF2339 domain-containing protein [Candidatus Angelobacter sp.]